ncbi:MAG: VWA domain-containing protein [Lachnospiraceae bacterium]|nr:VWA domain-containing protein [Lachnospiraceae bacterium]
MKGKLKLGTFLCIMVICFIVVPGCEKKQKDDTDNVKNTEQQISANKVDQSNMDVVFVMDKSDSMIKSDKNRVAVTGAKMFLDMMRDKGSNVAVVDFANKASDSSLVNVESQKSKDYIKEYLNSIKYGSGHTDYGLALKKAVSLLEDADGNNQKAILFFTDGNLYTGKKRDKSEAEKDIEDSVSKAKKKGYRVYCIGLNNNNKIDKVRLSKIASDTNGKYYIINKASELLDVFNSIFTDVGSINEIKLGSVNGKGSVSFKVDDENIAEANIIMLSDSKLSDVELYNQKGKKVNLSDDGYIFSSEKGYSVLKIIKPAAGNWKVYVKGVKNKKIQVNMVYNYDLSIQADAVVDKAQRGGIITISSFLVNNGEQVKGKKFYKKLEAVAKVKLLQDEKEKTFDNIKMKASESGFKTKVKMDEIGEYNIIVHIEDKQWYRDSEVMSVSAEKLPVKQIKKLTNINLKKGETKKIELLDYFTDPEGEELIFDIVVNGNDNNSIDESLEGSVLTVSANDTGSEKIDIAVLNEYGQGDIVTVKIKGETFISKYGIIIAAAFILIIIIAIARFCKYINSNIRGLAEIGIIYEEADHITGIPNVNKYNITNSIRLSSIGSHVFTADKLLRYFGEYYRQTILNSDGKYDSMETLSKEKLRHVIFKPGSRKGYSILLKNKGKKEIKLLDENHNEIKGSTNKITISTNEKKKFGIKVQLSKESSLELMMVYKKSED